MKKTRVLLALVLGLSMLFTACAGETAAPASSSAPAADASAAAEAPSDEPITLRMAESLTSSVRTEVLRGLADAYTAEHPNVTIEIISPPFEGADEKISQMLMAKQQIDVLEIREQTITQFNNNGWIAPIDDYVASWDEKDTLTQAALQSMTAADGKTYLVPYGFYQRCLYYRKDLFDAAGLQPPKTWQELLETGIALTNPAENKYGYAFRGGSGAAGYAEMTYLAWLGTDNLDSLSAAFFLKDGNGATIFSTPEAKESLEFLKTLYEQASPKDSIAWGFSEMVQGFMNGTAAMLIQDSEVIATCEAELQPEQWGVAPMPAGPSGQAVFPNGFSGWGITSYTEYPDVAADFVLFLANSENNTAFARQQALIPIHTTASSDPFFSEGPFSVYMEMANNPDVFRFAMRPQMYQAVASYNVEYEQEYQKYMTGTITVDDLLAQLDQFWSTAYQEEGKLY